MLAFLARKRPRLTVASWLVMAVMGMFTFAVLDSVEAGIFTGNEPLQDVSSISVNYGIDCLAAASEAAGRGKETFSFRRFGSPAAVFFTGNLHAAAAALLPLNTISPVRKPDVKSAVLLKLRI